MAVAGNRSSPTLAICNPETGEQLESIQFSEDVTDFAFSPDDRQLAFIEYNGNVKVYDRSERRILFSELAHGRAGFGLAFSPDGRTLVTGSSIGEVKFWHVPTMMLITTIKTRGRVADLAFFPDGDTLGVGYSDRTIELWHVDRENELFSIEGAGGD
jgi:WD40 repeat protein